MDSSKTVCVDEASFDAQRMMRDCPPRFANGHKQAIFEAVGGVEACADAALHSTRWNASELPRTWTPSTSRCEIVVRSGVFEYDHDPAQTDETHWYLNFADPELFGYYSGGLLAQDELQVFEHPILGSLRHALIDRGVQARTAVGGEATPVLVENAQRRIAFDTMPDAAAGRPRGLYGNRFAAADRDTVMQAFTEPDPPAFTSILAIAAPPGGRGSYSAGDIRQILTTTYAGFAASALRSRDQRSDQQVVIHTGFWGCGAFGGNRVLTPALQLIAADLAGVDRLVFYAFDDAGVKQFADAQRLREDLASSGTLDVDHVVETLVDMEFPWGVGDGN